MKTIIWNDLALVDYHANIDFLLLNWSEKQAVNFIEDIENILSNLKAGIIEYKESNYKNVRECVASKQITLYYRHRNKNEIELLRFWNNTMDKSKLIV